jgi:hypothetical protein
MVVEMRSGIRTKSLKLLGAPDFAVEPPDQKLADLTHAPMRLLALQADNQGLDPGGNWLANMLLVAGVLPSPNSHSAAPAPPAQKKRKG